MLADTVVVAVVVVVVVVVAVTEVFAVSVLLVMAGSLAGRDAAPEGMSRAAMRQGRARTSGWVDLMGGP